MIIRMIIVVKYSHFKEYIQFIGHNYQKIKTYQNRLTKRPVGYSILELPTICNPYLNVLLILKKMESG